MAIGLRACTPLCPAGAGPSLPLRAFVVRKAKQLFFRSLRETLLTPLKGGDWLSFSPSPIIKLEKRAAALPLLISPLEGEMAGRPEGGWPGSSLFDSSQSSNPLK
jgi:hypothetical protein